MTAANTAAASQAKIAEEQWAQQQAFLPEAMQIARDQNTRAQRQADLAEEDASFYRGISQHQFDRSKLSEKYQDELFGLADKYSSGQVGNEMAGMANADVEQAYGAAQGNMTRAAARYGINPGSGAFAAAMGDMATQKAADSAGAQTRARIDARNKAESMVAMAAGAGQTAFGNATATGGMAGSFGAGSVGLAGSGLSGMNSSMGTYNQGASSAGNLYGQASQSFRANAIESAKSPGFDFMAGLATAGVQGLATKSDRRLKTGIRRVGATDDGIPVYTYRYKSGGPTVMGVMADEVEKVNPAAVAKNAIDNTYDAVFYGAL